MLKVETRILLLVLSIVLLPGCANGVKQLNAGADRSVLPGHGVVISSVEETTPISRFSEWTRFEIEKEGSSIRFWLKTRGSTNAHQPDFGNKTDPRSRGWVDVHLLEPGNYSLTGWSVGVSGAVYSPRDFKKITFNVASETVTYIGSLTMHLELQKNLLGIKILAPGNPTISDEFQRDVAAAIRNVPMLEGLGIRKNILVPDEYLLQASNSR